MLSLAENMKTSIRRPKSRFGWYLFDVKSSIVSWFKYTFWTNITNLEFWKLWLPLRVSSWFGLDIWYATKIIGLKFEKDLFAGKGQYHFHTKSGHVIRPSDYGYKSPRLV